MGGVDILEKVKRAAQPKANKALTVEDAQNQILNSIQKINYPEKLGLSEDTAPKDREIKVTLCNELIEIAVATGHPIILVDDILHIYNGCYFMKCDTKQFVYFLSKVATKTGVKYAKATDVDFAKKLYEQFSFNIAGQQPEVTEVDGETLINTRNGTLCVGHDGSIALKKFDPADWLTYQLPYDYNRDLKDTLFKKYLNRVLPDSESQNVLSEFIGTCLTPNTNPLFKHEKMLMLLGGGANGKSVMAEIITALLASYVKHFSMDDIANPNGYALAELSGMRLNYATEFDGKIKPDLMKKLASGEPVTARRIYGAPFMLRNYGRLMFNLNKMPHGVEHTHAFERRFLIIPFTQTISEQERDVTIAKNIIENELPGVLNWVLDGLLRFIKNGYTFSKCDAAKVALEEYKLDTDSVKSYLNEREYVPAKDGGNFRVFKEIYNDYKVYCEENGLKPVSNKEMIKRMTATKYIFKKIEIGKAVYITFKSSPDGQTV